MSNPPPPRPSGGGLSLYANLLDGNQSTSVSGAPVLYPAAAPKKPINASLQFQPIRRPQPSAKPGPKPGIFPKSAAAASTGAAATASSTPSATPAPPAANPSSTTLADWTNLDDDDLYHGSSHNNKRRRKKKNNAGDVKTQTNWNEIYDPTRPTNVDEYLASDERVWEIREWRAVLYRHRQRRRASESDRDSGSEGREENTGSVNRFAPPASYSAVPPPPRSPPAPAPIPDDATGDDAYARRLALFQAQSETRTPPQPPPPAPPSEPETYSATISSAPVLYSTPQDPPSADTSPPGDPPPRSSVPGQHGFAQRLMGKYGWASGTGLGANSSGITSALHVKQNASGKGSGSMGTTKIVGGKKKPGTEEEGYGKMSEVVVLQNMLEGMEDLEGEIAEGLGQEIGEECGDKYGRVERLKIDIGSRQVFIKFTDSVSALRAVSELNGRVFNGNAIIAKFFDSDKFERGTWK